MAKVEELEKEKAEKELKSFEIKLDIKPEYHPKIIGHKGGVISKFRTDFDVNIQLPKRDHPEQSTITITGYESNALKARDAIMKKIEEFVSISSNRYHGNVKSLSRSVPHIKMLTLVLNCMITPKIIFQ